LQRARWAWAAFSTWANSATSASRATRRAEPPRYSCRQDDSFPDRRRSPLLKKCLPGTVFLKTFFQDVVLARAVNIPVARTGSFSARKVACTRKLSVRANFWRPVGLCWLESRSAPQGRRIKATKPSWTKWRS
jgi:hypothetical protein